MKRFTRFVLGLLLLLALLPAGVANASPQPQNVPVSCEAFAFPGSPLYIPGSTAISGTTPSGAETCLIVPQTGWNGGLVVFAHGYVFAYPPDKAVTIPWDQMIMKDAEGNIAGTIPHLVLEQHFAFATTSYSKNGLAVVEGVNDVLDLVSAVKATLAPQLPAGTEIPVFLIGASEGGLVTTLAVENYPKVFRGGVAACGPIGDFREQINYWGDLRVAYDYYFPNNMLGGSAMAIPDYTMAQWGSLYAPPETWGMVLGWNYNLIKTDLEQNGGTLTQQLLAVTHAPVVPQDPRTYFSTILGILEYNVYATNEAIVELHGVPYSNSDTVYLDPGLNAAAERITADKEALKNIKKEYQTTGLLKRPLVVMHTTGDPIVPYWHTELYSQKVAQKEAGQNLRVIPITRYGHCAFTPQEEFAAFQTMLEMAFQQPPLEAKNP